MQKFCKSVKIWQSYRQLKGWDLFLRHNVEYGTMPNVITALPNIGGALCAVPCSNAAKTWNPLKLAGVPKTSKPISVASRPKFTILWGHVQDILLLNKFFPIVDTCLSCEDIARQSCAMVPDGDFLHPEFSASRVQQVSDLHLKFALRPHHVWKYGRHPIYGRGD